MFKSGGFPAPLVALNSMIKVLRCLLCNTCKFSTSVFHQPISSIFRPQRLPSHSRPFPASPCLHVQLYDPLVLLQNA